MGAEISVRYGTSAGAHAYLPTGSLVPVEGGLEWSGFDNVARSMLNYGLTAVPNLS